MTSTRDCTPGTARGRLLKAEQFLTAAEAIDAVLDRDDDPDVGDAYVTLCIHAGIAAADVMCCRALGVHSQGDDHTEAVALLRKVDKGASNDLDRLLRLKTKAGYSARSVSSDDRKRADRAASRLVARARRS